VSAASRADSQTLGMCGICGFVGERSPGLLERMLGRLEHRGPDDVGHHVDPTVSIGVRRLAIIDVGGGRQPAASEAHNVTAVLNGEIYNYRELRTLLGNRGHSFGSQSDTEVLPHLYEEFGPQMTSLLRGMFAFAIWDSDLGRLLVARDRAGEKPLLYAMTRRGVSFASELKALMCDGGVGDDLDPVSLRHYLTLQYVPGPRTILSGVRKLPPGHYMTYSLRDGLDVRPYWELIPDAQYPGMSFAGATAGLRARLADSVRAQMHAERPVGALLSGGIDSSAVVAHMTREGGQSPVRTFTVGFEGTSSDEREAAREVARVLGTEHTEMEVPPPTTQDLESCVWHLDEPIGDQAALPTMQVVQAASEHVTVLLTGEGSDELLAGYPRYGWFQLAEHLSRLPPRLARRLAPGWLGAGRGGTTQRRLDLLFTPRTAIERHLAWVGVFPPHAAESLLLNGAGTDVAEATISELEELSEPWRHLPPSHAMMALDFKLWLPDNILTKADRMSMASSVEARAPFLDLGMIEFASSLPPSLRLRGRGTKALLRASLAGMLPRAMLSRRKRAFGVPVQEWLGRDLRRQLHELLLAADARSAIWIDRQQVRRLLAREATPDVGRQLWTLGILELWLRQFQGGGVGRVL
jgi:asparagine synthase (glutamine-hydrolysing)